jgi:Beta-propeller repeat
MSKRALFFGLAALLVLTAGTVLIVNSGWCHKAPPGTAALSGLGVSPAGVKDIPVASEAKAHALINGFGRVPVYFVPNRGQADDRVNFYVQGDDKTVYFSQDGLTLALNKTIRGDKRGTERWAAKLDFLGARTGIGPEGLEKAGAVISYFRGKPEKWKSGLDAYSSIIYRDLWPGIDLIYNGEPNQLKYEFIVRPGADPSNIKLVYRGVDTIALTEEGRLDVNTPAGAFEDDVPVAYQELAGKRQNVPVAYTLDQAKTGPEGRSQAYGFVVGEYDRSRTLVLDPIVLVYCGYIGGNGWNTQNGIAVDNLGNAYIAGQVASDDTAFPVTVGPDLLPNGHFDAFVAKVNASGTALVYCGYIGGDSWDDARQVAVDSAGNAYVVGWTASGDTTFPVVVGPDVSYNGGGDGDGYVAKINPDGTALIYCGYIGGSEGDCAYGVDVDSSGNAYVGGCTFSKETSFPVKNGPDLTYNDNGSWGDAFVARVNASGTGFDYCGYIGGSDQDVAEDVACDASGNAYVTGKTTSRNGDFPVKVGPDLTFNGSTLDAFVAKVSTSGALVYCGFIGGNSDESGEAIAVDSSGNAYVTGVSWSDGPSFPLIGGPTLYNKGQGDAFVTKVDASGASLVYSGFIGGTGADAGYGIAVDGSGNAYITGTTASSESGTRAFPVVDGPDLTYNGGARDAFVAKVNPPGTGLIYCGYIGGAVDDDGFGIAVDGSGYAYVTGYTTSGEDSFPVVVGPVLTHIGAAYVAKIGDVPGPPIASLSPDSADAGDPGFLLSVYGSDFVDGAVVRWDGSPRTTTFVSSYELQATIGAPDLAAGKTVLVTVRNPNGGISNALAFSIDNPLPSLASLSPTHVTGGGAAFTLTIQGTNFVPNSVVRWNGSDRTTTYVSATELQAAITAADIAAGGQSQVTVFNPAPSGGLSGALAFQVSNFTLGSTPTSVTVSAGQSATYTIEVAPQNGSFDSAVSLSCAGLPTKCTATFSPASVTPGGAAVTSSLTLATQASSAAPAAAGSLSGPWGLGPSAAGLMALAVIWIMGMPLLKRTPRQLSRRWIAVCAVLCLVILIGSCSSGGGDNNPPPYNGTPKGTHTISVQGTSGAMTVPISITLVVN